jgi:lipopolysaccharide export LptBFGC system permease protein LptF
MKKFSWIISKYLLQNFLPYFIFSWLLLSVILFVQQASRYSDIFFNTILPKNLVWQLSLALIPNVIAFTAPMAVLIGVIIGLSKMQGDSELVAIRAAGIGNFRITVPIIFIGIILSLFAFFINLKGVPLAAQIVRKVALQTALYKLESPLEPGVFNTEINGFTIYVKNVNFENGTWEDIFIINEDKNKQVRLITSKSGKIASSEKNSELVLDNANITTLNIENNEGKLASESVREFRFGIQTKRGELINKITSAEETPDEMGLIELARYAGGLQGLEKIEANILWQRRIILSITPLIFALLGTALVLSFNSGGKGFGIFLALISLVAYYLITLLSEQLARTGKISVFSAGIMPIIISSAVIIGLFLSSRFFIKKGTVKLPKPKAVNFPKRFNKNFYIDLTTGILDFDIVKNLFKYFVLTIAFLASIYIIFTAFELWKFAGTINNGFILLTKYLFYLLPFIYIQLAPSAVMIAVLATYIIKSRRNEIVTWTASGQSVYRLLLPCFILMLILGGVNWLIQEKLLPDSNRIQDTLRTQIRNRGVLTEKKGKYWVANDNRIFSFEIEGDITPNQPVNNLSIYEFTKDRTRIKEVYKSSKAIWEDNKIRFIGESEKIIWIDGIADIEKISNIEISESYNPFANLYGKPGHLSSSETVEKINKTESDDARRNLEVALEKKYSTLILPFIITLFTAPFALSLSRKSKVITVGYAVGFWLMFMGIGNFFEQLGLNGYISPTIAVWSPLLLFSVAGIYFLSKIRT